MIMVLWCLLTTDLGRGAAGSMGWRARKNEGGAEMMGRCVFIIIFTDERAIGAGDFEERGHERGRERHDGRRRRGRERKATSSAAFRRLQFVFQHIHVKCFREASRGTGINFSRCVQQQRGTPLNAHALHPWSMAPSRSSSSWLSLCWLALCLLLLAHSPAMAMTQKILQRAIDHARR